MKKVMTIAGMDSGGGAGIAADLKTFSVLGVHGTGVVTSLTAQNTRGVFSSFEIPPKFIMEQFEAVVEDIRIDYVKTGMLSSPDIVRTVAHLIQKEKLPLVIDPVISAEAGGRLLNDDALKVMIDELIPLCDVITPNVPEGERLSGTKITSMSDVQKAAKIIHDLGAEAVIITGGHLDGTDVLYSNGEFTFARGELIKAGTHGSGCTHSAVITALLSKGVPLIEALQYAREFVGQAIRRSVSIGSGSSAVNQAGYILEEAERYRIIKNVEEALEIIKARGDFSSLIPEVGCNIAMGIENASSISDVAAVSGRIVNLKGLPHAVGCVAFGASSHIARIILTAMQYDGQFRAAMNIRYSEDAIMACENLDFEIASFSREEEPEAASTMEWSVTEIFGRKGKKPEIVYDIGGFGKEAMIRILGHKATDVAGKAVCILDVIKKK